MTRANGIGQTRERRPLPAAIWIYILTGSYVASYFFGRYPASRFLIDHEKFFYWARHCTVLGAVLWLAVRLLLSRSHALKSAARPSFLILLPFFVTCLVADAVFAPNSVSLERQLSLCAQTALTWGMVVAFSTVDEEYRKTAATACCLALVFLLAITPSAEMIQGHQLIDFRGRLYMGMASSTDVSQMILVALMSFLGSALCRRRAWRWTLLPFLFLLGALSQTRALFVSAFAFGLVLFTAKRGRLAALFAVGILGLALAGTSATWFDVRFDDLDAASSKRVRVWRAALHRPIDLIGHGGASGHYDTLPVFDRWLRDHPGIIGREHVDNYYLEVLLEYGLIGLLALLAGLVGLCWKLCRFEKTCCLGIAALAAVGTLGFFNSALLTSGNLVSVYCWLEIGSSLYKAEQSRHMSVFESEPGWMSKPILVTDHVG